MQVPLVVVQRRVPMCPARQSRRIGSRQLPQLVVAQDTPDTLALQACISIVDDEPEQVPAPLHVGVVHMRVCRPVRSQVPGIVCVHEPHGAHDVAPHVEPVASATMHDWLSAATAMTHAPALHAGVVVVRVCVPVVAHVAPTMQADHALITTLPQGIVSVERMQACDSGVSVAAHAPAAQ